MVPSSRVPAMEKLVYLLLGPDAAADPGLAAVLHERTVPALRSLGAHSVQVNATDRALGPPFGVAPDPASEQIIAAVSLWVDAAEGSRVGGALPSPGPGAAWHGWLVCESEPM